MEKTVTFTFAPNDRVKTVTGGTAIIDGCLVEADDSQSFLVLQGDRKTWYRGCQLTLEAETKDESQDSEG